jgi:hypothetical protein
MPARRSSKIQPPKHIVPVKLDPELAARVAALAQEIGEAQSTVMRFAMRIGLRYLEEAHKPKPIKPIDYRTPPQGGFEMND